MCYRFQCKCRSSSVWCLGPNHTQRRCRFTNLCYKPDTNDYVFLYDDNLSVKSGLPPDRFSPALADMSSVSDHNQYYFNFVEIPAKSLAKLSQVYSVVTLRGRTLVMSRFKPDNLMHYFHDDIIPLYFTLQELGSKRIDSILLDDIYSEPMHKPFDPNIFHSVFPKSLIRSELNDKSIYCMEESFVGLSKATTFYDYGFTSPQRPIERSAEESLLISKTVRQLMSDLTPIRKCTQNYVIFISRQLNRRIVNENDLIELFRNYTNWSVVVVNDLNNNFEAILEKIFCTKILVGIHGSALILSLFLRPDSALIELFPFAINPEFVTPYKTSTQLRGMKIHYFYWRNLLANHTITHEEYPKELGGIQHLSDEERQQIVSNREEVPKQMCCDDPYWLYRMYSDTIVDIRSFTPVVVEALEAVALERTEPEPNCQSEPGVVVDLKCERIDSEDTQFVAINWQKPWNIGLMECSHIELVYEVLIQELPSVSAQSVTVYQNEVSFELKANKIYYVWVRSKLNAINGPFNTNPLMC